MGFCHPVYEEAERYMKQMPPAIKECGIVCLIQCNVLEPDLAKIQFERIDILTRRLDVIAAKIDLAVEKHNLEIEGMRKIIQERGSTV